MRFLNVKYFSQNLFFCATSNRILYYKKFKHNLLHARIQAFLLVVLSLVTIFTQSQNLKFQVRVNYSENIFIGSAPGRFIGPWFRIFD